MSEFTLPMFGGSEAGPPPIVARIWNGKDRHYATSTTQPYDRTMCQKQLCKDHGAPSSYSTIDRAHRDYGPHGKKVAGLLPEWPIARDQHRPWLSLGQDRVAQMHVLDRPGGVGEIATLELNGHPQPVSIDENGIIRVLKQGTGGLAAAVALFLGAFGVLDLISDGKLDGVIEWCRLLLPHHANFHL